MECMLLNVCENERYDTTSISMMNEIRSMHEKKK